MVFNLCDNAVKYNREGGSVEITTGKRAGHPFLSVKEENNELYLIDIPQEHRSNHEAHFSKVAKTFLHYLQYKDMPEWENENIISKYYITTTAVEMAKLENN